MKKSAASREEDVRPAAREQRIPPATVGGIGRALFGPHWQAPLARAMKVAEQAMRRWTNDGVPASHAEDLREILAARAKEIQGVLKELEEFGGDKK